MNWLARTVGKDKGVKAAAFTGRRRDHRDGSGRAFAASPSRSPFRPPFRRTVRALAATALTAGTLSGGLLAGAAPVFAHEFYLQPSTYRTAPGQPIAFTLGVGHAFEGDPLPYSRSHVAQFFAESPTGIRRDIEGIEGVHPAGIARLPHGDWSVLYAGKPWMQVLSRDALKAHFEEVGRADLLKAAHEREVRERVYRCARALVTSAVNPEAVEWSKRREADCAFDVVPLEQSPTTLRMALLRDGKPVTDWRISISAPEPGSTHSHGGKLHRHRHTVTKTTDARGTFTIDLTGASGDWLVTAVQVEPTHKGDEDARAGADYRSYWASLSFHIGTPESSASATDRR